MIKKAMDYEKASMLFYFAALKLLPENKELNDVLLYFASIEGMHYELLRSELEHAEIFGDTVLNV
jgi:rubrerythrin